MEKETLATINRAVEEAMRRAFPDRLALLNAEKPYTIQEAAARLGVGHTTIRELIATGALPSFRIGKVVRIPKADVDSILQSKEQ